MLQVILDTAHQELRAVLPNVPVLIFTNANVASLRGEVPRRARTHIVAKSPKEGPERLLAEITKLVDIPDWLDKVLGVMDELLRLNENWDGRGAKKIDPTFVVAATDLLFDLSTAFRKVAQVVPTRSGGLQFEYLGERRQ